MECIQHHVVKNILVLPASYPSNERLERLYVEISFPVWGLFIELFFLCLIRALIEQLVHHAIDLHELSPLSLKQQVPKTISKDSLLLIESLHIGRF